MQLVPLLARLHRLFTQHFSVSVSQDKQLVLLFNPPYGDITQPYHSCFYVAAPLIDAGFDVRIFDFNILWVRKLFTSSQLAMWGDELQNEIDRIESLTSIGLEQQRELVNLIKLRAICVEADCEATIEVFQSDRFYNFDEYQSARRQFTRFELLLDHFYRPYRYSTSFRSQPPITTSGQVFSDVISLDRLLNDFKSILVEQGIGNAQPLFCGVSMPFNVNVVPGLVLTKALKEVYGNSSRVIAGGTALTDIYRGAKTGKLLSVFTPFVDAFFLGEAETGIVEYAQWCDGIGEKPPKCVVKVGDDIEQEAAVVKFALLSKDDAKQLVKRGSQVGKIVTETMPIDQVDWGLYLSPARQFNLSPTRGCFWNQCTFCDYGFNTDGPTSPSRESDLDVFFTQMKSVMKAGVTHIYFAVDAIAPRYLSKVSERILAENLKISWSAELIITKNFNSKFIRRLEESGMITFSFGFESGSSRVLEMMGKGSERMEQTIIPAFNHFRESTIALQPKFFFGFPTETTAERRQTIDVLLEYHDLFGVLTRPNLFSLSAGSIVAKNPEKFGLTNMRSPGDFDISRDLEYDSEDDRCEALNDISTLGGLIDYPPSFERPWAGGIDTFHTKLYLERFGKSFFQQQIATKQVESNPLICSVTSKFNLDDAMLNVTYDEVVRNVDLADTHYSAFQTGEIAGMFGEDIHPVESASRYELAWNI